MSFASSALVLNGGTLQYVGYGANAGNSDRGFTIGALGATLDASGGSTFTLSAGTRGYGAINDNANGPLTLQGSTSGNLGLVFGGTGSLTKQGAGQWTLSAVNTYTGGTAINGGVLVVTNTGALGLSAGQPAWTSTGNIAVSGAGSTLVVTAGTNAGEFSPGTGGGVFQVLSNVNFGPNTNLGLTTSENITYGANIANSINGPLGIQKSGTGTLTLSGINTYTNGTVVNGGVLVATNTSALGLSGGQPSYLTPGTITVVNPGSTLTVQAGSSAGPSSRRRTWAAC